MFAVLSTVRKALRPVALGFAGLALAACDPSAISLPGVGGGGGPIVDPSMPVTVALLLPKSDPQASSVAADLEKAARLALAETGANIDLRVYDTAGSASTAAAQAQRAVDEGAKIILGPLRQEATAAAGLAVLDEGINVLSFSNNAAVAGGNVFVLGQTYPNIANRLMGYARKQGKRSVTIIHSDDVPGQVGRLAIEQAASANGISVTTALGYPLSIEGVNATAQAAGAAAGSSDSIFITTESNNAAMPMLLQTLPESGVSTASTQYIGLSRWDVRPDLFKLPGAEGAWFALPDQGHQQSYSARFSAANGGTPHPLSGLGYDGVAAVGSLLKAGKRDALTAKALTSANFNGALGAFRMLPDGTNARALAVATIKGGQMTILEPAPASLGSAGF